MDVRADPVEQCLDRACWIEQEYVLIYRGIAQKDGSFGTMAQRCQTVCLIHHVGIVKDDSVKGEWTLLKDVLSQRERRSDQNLCLLHSVLDTLISCSIILTSYFESVPLVQILSTV